MIIKYFVDGWNYIDNASKIKARVIEFQEVIDKIRENRDEDDIVSNDQVISYIHHDAMNNYGECADEVVFDKVDFNMEANWSSKLRVVFYNDAYGSRQCIMFNATGYILNDNGKTIERI